MSTVTSPDGTTIDYDSYGSGPVVVLIGGATQFRAIDQRSTAVAKLLADNDFTAIDYDRRGRGKSGDTTPWSIEREVDDVAALIAASGGRASLSASSSGSAIALAAATADIGVDRVALYEPPFFAGNDLTERINEITRLIRDGQLDDAMRYNLTRVIGMPTDAVDGMSRAPWWPTMCTAAATLVYDFSSLHAINIDSDWTARWANVSVPVAVLSGTATFPGLAEASDAVARALPNAERRILAGQGHGPEPELLVRELVQLFMPN